MSSSRNLDQGCRDLDRVGAAGDSVVAKDATTACSGIGRGAVTGQYKAYPEYRESGVEWLGELPGHWRITRAKFLATVQTGIAKGKDNTGRQTMRVPYLRVANVQDGYLDLETVSEIEITIEDLPRYLLRSGDVLMNEGGDYDKLGRGHIWQGEITSCVHQNHVFAVRPHRVSPEWLNTVTGAGYAQFYFMSRSKQSTNLASISSSNIMELPVVVPPDGEQQAILAFLDHETAKIDRLIAKQEELIALLKEKRQAVISHAVTKGLNPDAPMKDSGVEWLGEIPAHWIVKRLKHISSLQSGIAKGKDLNGRASISVPYLRVANVQDGYIDIEDVAQIEVDPNEVSRYLLRKGDVLMNEGGDNDKLGRGAIWNGEIVPCIHQNHVFAIRPHSAEPEWISLITQSLYAKFHFFSLSKQSTNLASISSSNLMELPIVVPPADERQLILTHVECVLEKMKTLINLSEREVEFLQERRTALISAAVTGKIDVRGWTPEGEAHAR